MDLKTHCIETAIRLCYNQLLSRYFQSQGDDTDAEQKLSLLQKALALFDFSALRTLFKELGGNSDARICLTESDDGSTGIIIDDRTIDIDLCLRK